MVLVLPGLDVYFVRRNRQGQTNDVVVDPMIPYFVAHRRGPAELQANTGYHQHAELCGKAAYVA